ncbi:hypothetical protein [Bacillus sp. MUM 116]|nr:hypothetical protein [Bacillus sp. MUM 116]
MKNFCLSIFRMLETLLMGDRDVLKIVNAKNGDVAKQFIFDGDMKSWIP